MKKMLFLIIMLTFMLFLTGCTENLENAIDDATYAYPSSKETIVTLKEYNNLKSGMTEQEVWNIIGGKCTSTGTTDLGMGDKYVTNSYGCNGYGTTGANVILMFQGGKLISFNQAGLK